MYKGISCYLDVLPLYTEELPELFVIQVRIEVKRTSTSLASCPVVTPGSIMCPDALVSCVGFAVLVALAYLPRCG